ncbi:hypothetical protein QAD02_012930 [Eretmocerus hayati]|uniref:Uncharacterized protein n=1 Tax=Eretmocerus hayati TaxID=131215 RepID=A0ACC2P203_9HYME|nr:hypothetical protein QAD02_012930 [Eretmocerus hayati]
MGERALTSHANSDYHKKAKELLVKNSSFTIFMQKKNSEVSNKNPRVSSSIEGISHQNSSKAIGEDGIRQNTSTSGATDFLKEFCSTRWVENADIAENGIIMVPHLLKYVESWDAKLAEIEEKSKNHQEPVVSKSYKTVSRMVKDRLIIPKLSFFSWLARIFEPFLTFYQSNNPSAPFLFDDLSYLLTRVMTRFVQPEELRSISNITEIDLKKESNLIPGARIDLAFATKDAIRQCKKTLALTDKEILSSRQDCRAILVSFCFKLFMKSPLKWPLVKAISCLDPKLATNVEVCKARFSRTLEILIEHKWISGCEADNAVTQLNKICGSDIFHDTLKSFRKYEDRLDHLWLRKLMAPGTNLELSKVLQLILSLSHGNAWIERGFSVNEECLVENLHEDSLIAQRIVYDSLQSIGGIQKIESKITKSMMHYY